MITDNQFAEAASFLGCEVATIKAIREVESSGGGFLKDNRLKMLFEGHIFWKQLQALGVNPATLRSGYEDICYEHWTTKHYLYGAGEWQRFNKAIVLTDKLKVSDSAVFHSASYGAFQLMGFNYSYCGFNNVHDLVNYLGKGEYEQLVCFLRFVKSKKLDVALKAKDWSAFAYRYNGSGYKGNPNTTADDYDLKIATAYKKHSLTKTA
jgi:hypothetical protein